MTIEFTQPASKVNFFFIGLDTLSGQFGRADVYVNGSYSITYTLNGVFNSTGGFSLPSTTNVTKIVIHSLTDPAGVGIDDLTFTIASDVKITNPRISGSLNGTTQTALLGADIQLNATPIPNGFAGGTYSWSFSGPYAISLGSQNSSSVTIRSINTGTLAASVLYTKNGITATASVTINAVLPTLTSFTAEQGLDLVSPPGQCLPDPFWWFKLGCLEHSQLGIHFTSRVHAPPFISNPTQSGVKYVQAVSTFRKWNEVGVRCLTKRSSESAIESGWQLDTNDPYSASSVHFFSEGNDLDVLGKDYPRNALTFISSYEFNDVLYIDDRFEMYVVYFSGTDAAHPPIQRPLGKLAWNWGGLVVLDLNGSNAVHNLRYSLASVGIKTGTATSSMVNMQGNVVPHVVVPCPGGPPLTNNRIDSSRVFVKYHYLDFLGRHPDGDPTHPPDPIGWNFWTSTISQCIFDLNCIHAKRIDTGIAFFYSAEFIGTDPDMANPPGSPGFNPPVYNRRFVFWCYKKYLLKEPDQEGWDFWTNILNSTGNYHHIIDSFQLSGDYRDRQFF